VRVACLAQLVNAIAPILTETGGPAWRQTIFHPFAHFSRYGRGRVLRAQVESPSYATSYFDPRGDEEYRFPLPAVPYLKLAAVHDAGSDGLNIFALNRSLDSELEFTLDARQFGQLELEEALSMSDADLEATNTRDAPDRVRPAVLAGVRVDASCVQAVLPPASWNVLRLRGGR
jgi:alpha-N-arabinofuranosidase